jgi:hypothetical protein
LQTLGYGGLTRFDAWVPQLGQHCRIPFSDSKFPTLVTGRPGPPLLKAAPKGDPGAELPALQT